MGEIELPVVKVPKGTPAWAVGLVAILCVLIGWYIAARPEINAALQNVQEIALRKAEVEKTTMSSVLGLVKSNGEQIGSISIALGQAQAQVSNLAARVQVLERQLSFTEIDLKKCEERVAKCKV